jgi:7-dehydrocholesterol reductase
MVHADGSILYTFEYLKQNGIDGLKSIWPMPTPIAWKIIACFGAFEAFLQLALPGKRFEGPVSPAGNVPVYKVSIMFCHVESPSGSCQFLVISITT